MRRGRGVAKASGSSGVQRVWAWIRGRSDFSPRSRAVLLVSSCDCERTGCEWKTRYEMQIEMNEMLDMQIASLTEKADDIKRTTKDGKCLNYRFRCF